jgi:beta-alanine degradation protein BauB
MTDVGTRIVFEDDQIIVWHLSLEPGEQGGLHTHALDYVVRIISGSTIEVTNAEGEELYTVEVETGGIVNFRIDGDQVVSDRPGQASIPATHRARNVGSHTFREVLIEFK